MWLAALEIYEALGIDLQVARINAELAGLSNASGDPVAAIEYGRVAAEIFKEEEFLRLIVLGNLAESYEQTGDLARARSTALEVLEGQRRIGDRDGVAYMSFALASIALAEGDLAESQRRLIECFTVATEVGFVELTAYALGVAGELALASISPRTRRRWSRRVARAQADRGCATGPGGRAAGARDRLRRGAAGGPRGGARAWPRAPPGASGLPRDGARREGRLTWSSACSARWR